MSEVKRYTNLEAMSLEGELVLAYDYDVLRECYDGLHEAGTKLLTERDSLAARLEDAEGRNNDLVDELAAERFEKQALAARVAELEDALRGWDGYAWKDGKYHDDLNEYFAPYLSDADGGSHGNV